MSVGAPRRSALPAWEAKAAGSASYRFTISTSNVDRMGDTVNVNGWKLAAYGDNPVVLRSMPGPDDTSGSSCKVASDIFYESNRRP